MIQWCF